MSSLDPLYFLLFLDFQILNPPSAIGHNQDGADLVLRLRGASSLRVQSRSEVSYPGLVILEHFFTGCFGLDILFNFNTALIGQGGALIFDRRKIAQDYLRAWFWIDFVATFPFEIITGGGGDDGGGSSAEGVGKLGRLGKIFCLLRISKLLRILKLGRVLRRLKHSSNLNPNWYLLGRTVAIVAFALHWTACGYWVVVENQVGSKCNN
jgi:hypothetical protein